MLPGKRLETGDGDLPDEEMSSTLSGDAEAPGSKPVHELPGLKHRSGPANPAAQKKAVEDDEIERQVKNFNVFM